jgi:hypothetical protein
MQMFRLQLRRTAPAALILLGLHPVMAAEPVNIELTLKDHRFLPDEIHLPTGKPAILKIRNEDATAEEFDSSDLQVEKIIAGKASVTVRLRPLGPGRFRFMGEFHPETAQGVVISE